MSKPLSPAAQAVLEVTGTIGTRNEQIAREFAAAILRAAADQVVSEPYAYASQDAGWIKDELLAIAAELEAPSSLG